MRWTRPDARVLEFHGESEMAKQRKNRRLPGTNASQIGNINVRTMMDVLRPKKPKKNRKSK